MATELVLLGTAGAPALAGLHTDVTEVGSVAQRAGKRFSGRTVAGWDGLRRTLPDAGAR